MRLDTDRREDTLRLAREAGLSDAEAKDLARQHGDDRDAICRAVRRKACAAGMPLPDAVTLLAHHPGDPAALARSVEQVLQHELGSPAYRQALARVLAS